MGDAAAGRAERFTCEAWILASAVAHTVAVGRAAVAVILVCSVGSTLGGLDSLCGAGGLLPNAKVDFARHNMFLHVT